MPIVQLVWNIEQIHHFDHLPLRHHTNLNNRIHSTMAPHVSSSHLIDICHTWKTAHEIHNSLRYFLLLHLDSIIRQQRILLTSPVFCSTPKQTRRPISNNNSHGRTTPTYKQRCCLDPHPPMPIISQRRLQFTPNSQSFVRYANDETKRIHLPNIKIWLL